MKGRKIRFLLQHIGAQQLQMLRFVHQQSKDKRSIWLFRWLESAKGMPPSDPELWWMKVIAPSQKQNNPGERDKIIRRWISFCTRELEKAVLWKLLDEQPAEIPAMMLRFLPPGELEGLTSQYLSPAFAHAAATADYATILHSLQLQLIREVNQDDGKSKQEGLEKLILRSRYADELFHRVKIDSLNMLSGLFLENAAIRAKTGSGFPTDQEIEMLCKQTEGTAMEAEYRVIQARFSHEHAKKFRAAVSKSEKIISRLDGKSKDLISRRLAYLKLIVGYTRGLKTATLLRLSESIHLANEKYGLPDSGGFFHYLLLLLLSRKFELAASLLKERGDFYFHESNRAMREFLTSFGAIVAPDQFSGQPSRLQALSYARNTYVSIWASLLFAAHHLRRDNADFAFVLLRRLRHRLKKLPPHFFTRAESEQVLFWMERKILNGGKNAPPLGLSPLHDTIIHLASL